MRDGKDLPRRNGARTRLRSSRRRRRCILETAIELARRQAGRRRRPPRRPRRHRFRRAVARHRATSSPRSKTLCPLAPLHQPHNLAPIEAIADGRAAHPAGRLLRHRLPPRQPALAQISRLPRELTEAGIRRYGFHGLSYEYVSAPAAEVAPSMPTSGSSSRISATAPACAPSSTGRSVATTMGFTAVEGLVMGTRCGSIDPGVLIYLMDERRHGCARARKPDLQEVRPARRVRNLVGHAHASRSRTIPGRARRSTCSSIGSSARSARWRRRSAAWTGWCSPAASASANAKTRQRGRRRLRLARRRDRRAGECGRQGRIDAPSSRIPIWVLPTDEERVIARHTAEVLTSELVQIRPDPAAARAPRLQSRSPG